MKTANATPRPAIVTRPPAWEMTAPALVVAFAGDAVEVPLDLAVPLVAAAFPDVAAALPDDEAFTELDAFADAVADALVPAVPDAFPLALAVPLLALPVATAAPDLVEDCALTKAAATATKMMDWNCMMKVGWLVGVEEEGV